MPRFIQNTLLVLFVVSVLIGCESRPPEIATLPTVEMPTATKKPLPTTTFTTAPTATFTPTPTATSTSTFTPTPTDTVTPLPTPSPKSTSSCNVAQMLRNVKDAMAYTEFEIHYQTKKGDRTLVVWFVDPELTPQAVGEDIEENSSLAMRHAALLSHTINQSDVCVEELISTFILLVVDTSYNGWFTGQVSPKDLPGAQSLMEAEVSEIESLMHTDYFRNQPTIVIAPPSDSCDWSEAREKIQLHFASEREAVSFFFSILDDEAYVWAQWDGQGGMIEFELAAVLNVAVELPCLYPPPETLIVSVVNASSEVMLIGTLPYDGIVNLDLNQFGIVYQP
jgi:hypothetical protein